MDKIITTKNKCDCGTNFILTIAEWKCPKCDLPKSIAKHRGCGGILEFDSFGNIKCTKCKEVFKDKNKVEVK